MKPTFAVSIVFLISCFASIRGNFYNYHDSERDKFIFGKFPENFKWGFATSSYQIEGGWNADGKGENIWDEFTHRNDSIVQDGATGDVACDSYHKYEEDVKLLKNIGANFYRFSISWARILPLGTLEKINQSGIDYYNNLINSLLSNGITPVVTMYHWDLPQALQDIGGWPNEELVDHFGNYARLLYHHFGDRVKDWITHNEPHQTCYISYIGILAPGIFEPATLPYQCGHTVIKSHARAYRIYEREFKGIQKGRVGISIDSEWEHPARIDNAVDIDASERALQFRHGWFVRPIFFGDYPSVMRETVDRKSKEEGRNSSRLPYFDEYWSKEIKGTWDFLGLNHYTTRLVTSGIGAIQWPGYASDTNVIRVANPLWPSSPTSDWLKSVPWGMRLLLNWIKNTYGNPEVLITENGWSDDEKTGLQDHDRSEYYRKYINEVLKAVIIDGCNVTAYTAWSLMDNFEWTSGYRPRFGVHHVNFTDPNRPRTPKNSARLLKKIMEDNGFPEPKASPFIY